jgi:WD40 repeat protein
MPSICCKLQCILFLLSGLAVQTEPPGVAISSTRPKRQESSAAFSPDGRGLAILDDDNTVNIWNVATTKKIKKIAVPLGRDESLEQPRYLPNGDLTVLLCHYKGVKFEPGPLRTDQGTVSVCLLNLTTDKRSPFINIGYGGLATCRQGELLAYASSLWQVDTGKKLREVILPRGLVYEIYFSPDRRIVLYRISESLAQDFALLFLVDVATGKKILQIGEIDLAKGASGCLFSPRFSPDGKWLAFSGVDEPNLHLWDLSKMKAVHRIPLDQSDVERVVGFTPDGRTLITWSETRGLLRLWEMATGKERQAIPVRRNIDAVLLSPDGKTVALVEKMEVEFRSLRN